MQKVVVLTGAGISAESGIQTFRDTGGLWEGYDVMEVASPEGWAKNPELILDFYNQRRKNAREAIPNEAHLGLVELEKIYNVSIITQNVDDLHERAGSTHVLHLHGELSKARSTVDESLIYRVKENIYMGDTCEKGGQLRPHIVWFGEMVPLLEEAIHITQQADIFLVIGTSLAVYPAASLIHFVAPEKAKYLIDPKTPTIQSIQNLTTIQKKATIGVAEVCKKLLHL